MTQITNGSYGHYQTACGPYGSATRAASYNPYTGTYKQGASVATPYGRQTTGQAYNPYTGTYAATHQGSSPTAQWGQSYVSNGNKSAYTQHYSTAQGTVASAQGSQDGKAVGTSTAYGNAVAGKTSSGDMYAGKDGNVYKNTGSGWQKYDNSSGSWNTVNKPQNQQQAQQQAQQQKQSYQQNNLNAQANAQQAQQQRQTTQLNRPSTPQPNSAATQQRSQYSNQTRSSSSTSTQFSIPKCKAVREVPRKAIITSALLPAVAALGAQAARAVLDADSADFRISGCFPPTRAVSATMQGRTPCSARTSELHHFVARPHS